MAGTRSPFALVRFVLLLGSGSVSAQETEEERQKVLGTTLVTATRSEQAPFEVPFSVEVVGEETIFERQPRTTPQIMAEMPGVSVQETSVAQGSPYIRGFTGFQNVFLIDGIRLNNSVFRAGPNQYWSTVDPLSISRLEVVKGPTSVLYGSDAIGGVVNAITRSPYTYSSQGFDHGERLYYRFASADRSDVVRGEISAGFGDDLGLLLGANGKWYDDLSGGEDIGRQEYTRYTEWNGDLKLEQFLSEDARMVFLHQRVQQDDAPRTHRTIFAEPFEGTTVGTDLRHDFDQDRSLTYLQLHGDASGGVESYHASVSWHDQEEELDRVRSNGAPSDQGFDCETLGMFAWFVSPSDWGRFTYGVDYYRDWVDSFSTDEPIQGPVADDASYDLVGVFLQDEIEASERLTLTFGARLNYAAVDADRVLDPVTDTETTLEDDWTAVVGSARFHYELRPAELALFGGVSQGFRAPNLSDLTRLDTARSNEFEIPSPGLDPEHSTSAEIGVKTRTSALASQLAVFYTWLDDAIVRAPNGNVTPGGLFEVEKRNAGDGHAFGVEAGASVRVAEAWSVFGIGTLVQGKVDQFPTSSPVPEEDWLDKLMPPFAELGVRWEDEKSWAESYVQIAGDASKLSPGDELDTQRIPPGGTPGYTVLGVRGGVQVSRHVGLDLALENLLDEDYRVHGSGTNRPGRNLIVGLTLSL